MANTHSVSQLIHITFRKCVSCFIILGFNTLGKGFLGLIYWSTWLKEWNGAFPPIPWSVMILVVACILLGSSLSAKQLEQVLVQYGACKQGSVKRGACMCTMIALSFVPPLACIYGLYWSECALEICFVTVPSTQSRMRSLILQHQDFPFQRLLSWNVIIWDLKCCSTVVHLPLLHIIQDSRMAGHLSL